MKRQTIVQGAAVMMIGTFASRILGWGRERVVSQMYGAHWYTDAYISAFSVPDLLYYLFAGGALSVVFIPVFISHLAKGEKDEGWRVASSVMNLMLVVLAVGVILEILLAPWLVRLIAPGYHPGTERYALTVALSRVLNVMVIFMGVSALTTGMLQALDHFTAPAVAWCTYSIGIIFGGTVIAHALGGPPQQRIYGLALGVLIGAASVVAVQLPSLWARGYRWRPILDLRNPSVRQIIRTFFPAMIGLAISQINLLQLPIFFGSFFGEGTNTIMRFAQRLIIVPLGLFGVSIATASFPTMARHAAERNLADLRHTLAVGLRAISFFSIPASIACAALALPINSVLWHGGQFSATAVARTATVMAYFSVGIFALCSIQIVTRGFYALKDFTTPPLVGLGTFCLNLALCWLLMHTRLRESGIALGISLAFWANLAALTWLLRARLGGIEGRSLLDAVMRTLLCCIPMTLAFWYVPRVVGRPFPAHPALSAAAQLVVAVSAGGALFLAAAAALHVPEVASAKGMLLRKLGRRPAD